MFSSPREVGRGRERGFNFIESTPKLAEQTRVHRHAPQTLLQTLSVRSLPTVERRITEAQHDHYPGRIP